MNENANSVMLLDAHPGTRTEALPSRKALPARVLGWFFGRALPNVLVLAALGGLAWWGHHTGWTLPKFAELTGAVGAEKDDWCPEHGVPESVCVECNESLLPRGPSYGWCKVHGVQECPLEHPDVAQLPQTPRITPEDFDRARRALAFADRPPNHPKYKLHERRLQFPSLDAVERANVKVTAAWQGRVVEAVAATGEIGYDPARVATLSTPVAGRIWYVLKDLGQPVKRGETLALVDAADVGKAKAEFIQALAQIDVRTKAVERLRPLAGSSVAGAELQKAEAELREAQIRLVAAQQSLGNLGMPVRADDLQGLAPEEIGRRLQFLGLPESIVKALDTRTATANLIPIVSALDGVVVSRKAVAGEQTEGGKALFVVADTRQMWLTLQVRQEEARLLRIRDAATGTPGQTVQFRPTGAEQDVVGELVWVSTEVDEKTRTVQTRAALANPDGQLRANAFGSGRVILREEPKAVVVPSESVQLVGDAYLVFVRDKHFEEKDAPKVFHPRVVRTGAKEGTVTEIIAGVLPGETVVTQGSGLLRSELLKNSLGEG